MARKPPIRDATKAIDKDAFKAAAEAWCNYRELATIFGVSEQTLHNNKELKDIVEIARASTKQSIRKKQIQLALEGNVQMLIWLGKNLLKQSETGVLDDAEAPKSFLPPVATLDDHTRDETIIPSA